MGLNREELSEKIDGLIKLGKEGKLGILSVSGMRTKESG